MATLKKSSKQKHTSWYKHFKSNPANAIKLKLLHQILKTQRRAFNFRCEEEELLLLRDPGQIDMKKLKDFLRHPHEGNNVNPVKINEKAAKKRRPIFLMLTKGGLQALENISTELWTKRANVNPADNQARIAEFLKKMGRS